MTDLKKNVTEFNADVQHNGGYRYTRNAPYSSIVSNARITGKTMEVIQRLGTIKTVVDVGCGDGTYTAQLKERFPAIDFTGFDAAAKAIELAASTYPHCTFVTGNILDEGSLPTGNFDLAIIRGVLHHLPTQLLAIKNAALLSATVLIIEPNGNNPILKYIEKKSAYHILHEEQSFSSGLLADLCRQNKLQVKSIEFIGFVPFFFPTIPSKIIHTLQPVLEKIPGLARYFGAQTIIVAKK